MGEKVDFMLRWLVLFPGPIRVPTACWLFGDFYNMLDSDVRAALAELQSRHHITIDLGGWIHVENWPEET